jgi:predicted deacetylase
MSDPNFMSSAHYLLRFDDICPTMRWDTWGPAAAGMARLGIRPILAVVPDNQDPKLKMDSANPDFWNRVRHWQSLGWTIALHGYQHLYANQDPGLMRLTHQSEFAGLSREAQEAKLRSGLAIFAEHGIRADAWVAPSHSFDQTTVELLAELGIPVLSDGMHSLPFRDTGGVLWIPQQLWRYKPKRSGIWTICYHHNEWDGEDLAEFLNFIEGHRAVITEVATMEEWFADRKRTWSDRLASARRMLWDVRLRSMAVRLRRLLSLRDRA